MKRAPFLGAAASVLVAGCGGGGQLMRTIPGATTGSGAKAPQTAFTLVPAVADPIPASVVAMPYIGEAWRFDGPTAPSGWALTQGQTLSIAQYPRLFSILGTIAGGDGKTTFKLPNPRGGMIIALTGIFPSSPSVLAESKRRNAQGGGALPPGARPSPGRTLGAKAQADAEQRAAAQRNAQQMQAAAIRVASAGTQPVSDTMEARTAQAEDTARGAVFAGLRPANQSRLEGLVDAILGRRLDVNGATKQLAAALDGGEARAILGVFDGVQRELRAGWPGMDHPDLQLEAARYAIPVAFTPTQLQALQAMSGNG